MWGWRLWVGWRIVPAAVKLRLALQGSLALAGLTGLWLGLSRWLPADIARLVAGAALVAGLPTLGYGLWCLLPDLSWGIPRALRGDLPCPPGQRVRLSFDDGPTPGLTDAVLDALGRHKIQATFFLLADKARRCPELVQRIVAEGHLLGLHGEDHRLVLGQSERALAASLGRARDELTRLGGQPITLYRPSHGFKNRALLRALSALGLRLVGWDFGVWDTDAPAPKTLLQRLRLTLPPRPAQRPPIVLLHDGRDDDPGLPPHQHSLLWALAAWLPLAGQAASRGDQRL